MADPLLTQLLAKAEAAQTAALQAQAEVREYLARESADTGLVPLKVAAQEWRVCIGTAISRARRNGGVKRFGRWYVPRSGLGIESLNSQD